MYILCQLAATLTITNMIFPYLVQRSTEKKWMNEWMKRSSLISLTLFPQCLFLLIYLKYIYIYKRVISSILFDICLWGKNNIKYVIQFSMLIKHFKIVYCYLHVGITFEFYESHHVSWLICAWKFTEWSRI